MGRKCGNSPKYHVWLAFALLSLSTACGDCVLIGIPALNVTVVDNRTGQSVLAGSTLIAVDGARRDSVVFPASSTFTSAALACCHGGTFVLTVKRPGYLDAVRTNIFVEDGRCGQPKTERVEMRMTAGSS
jgi:hypothetical protein